MSTIKVNAVQHLGGGSALTIDGTGYITTGQPVLAKLVMTSDQNNLTEETWSKMKLDSAVIDTASGLDATNKRWIVPSGQAGKYYFFTKLNFETTSGDDIIFVSGGFYKNGAAQNWGITNTSGGTTETFRQYLYNNSIILDLSVGDYVEVYGNAIGSNLALESNGSGNYETAFGGYKLI